MLQVEDAGGGLEQSRTPLTTLERKTRSEEKCRALLGTPLPKDSLKLAGRVFPYCVLLSCFFSIF